MAKINTFQWFLNLQIITTHNWSKDICHCWQIHPFVFHITYDLVGKIIFLKQDLQLVTKTNTHCSYDFKRPTITCFDSQFKVRKLLARTKVRNTPQLIQMLNVMVTKTIKFTWDKTNFLNECLIIKGNTSFILYDGNSMCGCFLKIDYPIHIFSTPSQQTKKIINEGLLGFFTFFEW
jgi:hypothetical protein